jgi:hypothetical protein
LTRLPPGPQNPRSVRTILLAGTALAALTSCQSAAEKQRPQAEAQSVTSPIVHGFAQCRVAVGETRVLQRYTLTTCTRTTRCGRPFGSTRRKATTTQNMPLPKVASSLPAAGEAALKKGDKRQHELPLPVPETQSAFHPHAQRNASRRRDVRHQSRSFAARNQRLRRSPNSNRLAHLLFSPTLSTMP